MGNYFSILKSYYINWYLILEAFNKARIFLITKGKKKLFPKLKATRFLITKTIFKQIIKDALINFDKQIIDIASKVVWIKFL